MSGKETAAPQGYLDKLNQYLATQYPNKKGLWNYSSNNTLPNGWLLATPPNVFGVSYANFKQAVPGEYPLFKLSIKDPQGPTQQSVSVQATVARPGDQPAKLLEGHSYGLYDEMYAVMVGAKVFLDITTLTPPTGRFLAAVTNALTFISNKPEDQRPIVRILYSNWAANIASFPDLLVDAAAFLKNALRNVDPTRKMKVYAGAINAGLEKGITSWASSWNHSKIVAADGEVAIVGGHNMWGEHYLDTNPVFDVSMKILGESATHAQDYADKLWRYVLWRMNDSLLDKAQQLDGLFPLVHTAAYSYDAGSGACSVKESYTAQTITGPDGPHISFVPNPAGQPDKGLYAQAKGSFSPQKTGTIPILSIGREAGMDLSHVFPDRHSYLSERGEPADQSMYQLFSMAQKKIRMSLQSFSLASFLAPVEWVVVTWDYTLFFEMAKALRRGVGIEVVLSNPNAIAGGLSKTEAPYDGEYVENVNKRLRDVLIREFYLDRVEAEALVSQKLMVTNFRFSADNSYPGGVPLPNHAKTFMIDDRLFYIGSQNQYRCNLAEFGYVVEDEAAARDYINNYWINLWEQSRRTLHATYEGSLEQFQNAEATVFIIDLLDNKRLNNTWQRAITDYTNAATEASAPYLAVLNDIISNAGYQTTAEVVIELTKTPFFTNERPGNLPNDESDRFVRDLLTKKELAAGFAAVIDAIDSGAAESDKAVNQFLQQKGYGCNVLQVYASLDGIRGSNLNYFRGEYSGAVVEDGGEAFDFTRPTKFAREAVGAAAEPSLEEIKQGPVLLIESDQSVKLDGVALVSPSYADDVLSWKQGNGNATGGLITFSEIPRPGLKDPFIGVECFGEITYPDSGPAPLKGKISFYARKQAADAPNQPSQPNQPVQTPSDWPLVISTLLGLGLILSLVGKLCSVGRDRWNRRDDRRDRYGERVDRHDPGSTEAFEMVERRVDPGLRRRRVGDRLKEASADTRGGWANDAIQGEIKKDVDHYVTEGRGEVKFDKVQSEFEQELEELVKESVTDDDYASESSRVATEVFNREFREQVRQNLTSIFRDQIGQPLTESMVKRLGTDDFKRYAADSIGAYLDGSIGTRLSAPMEQRMETPSATGERSYLEILMADAIVKLKADYLKDPANKAALQEGIGKRLKDVIDSQQTTAEEKGRIESALRQAEQDLSRQPSKENQARVDDLTKQVDSIVEEEKKLEEERREAEASRDELDPGKLEEKRKKAEKDAERLRKEIFRFGAVQ